MPVKIYEICEPHGSKKQECRQTYVNGDKVNLGVTVLSGLGGGHVDDLAGPALDDDVAADWNCELGDRYRIF